ncbi:uncharacterized protein PV09_08104 [Verruconis gallopava]|uniref:Uncharacterized protein n=1 Tax=Verruconis gallopava TaxID=253628 RepID=A0A0D2A245_9PEZI|nr:uncharacterized protein PV09_08104 [Verruconis gallopava]KIW00395.1 hypothetical protein PV09_08104 [Verruconis gallopava]
MRRAAAVILILVLDIVLCHPPGYPFAKHVDETMTVTVWETVQAPDYVVWVDENGKIVSQGVETASSARPLDNTVHNAAQVSATSSTAHPPVLSTYEPEAASDQSKLTQTCTGTGSAVMLTAISTRATVPSPTRSTDQVQTLETTQPQADSPSAATSTLVADTVQSATASDDANHNRSEYGISWSNYKGVEGDVLCKTFDDADREWSQMKDYDVVRIYGADCGQPGMALQLAKKYNKRVFVGIYFLDDTMPSQLQTIVDGVLAVGGDWTMVDAISIGNEDVHRGEKTPQQIFAFVASARTLLHRAGYRGPVVHVDSQDAYLANPELCGARAGDYLAANVHPFFNSQTSADQAGKFVKGQVDLLRHCGASQRRHRRDEIRVRVTETGWPKSGQANGAAVPGKRNQNVAVESIKRNVEGDVIMFSAYNNYWMTDDTSTFDTEHYWGLLDD